MILTLSLLPAEIISLHNTHRSAQLLQVCGVILFLAQPVLYSSTGFHVIFQAIAGKLPCTVTNGHLAAPRVQRLIWQLDCDLMRHFYQDDLRLDLNALSRLKSLELRCRAETWRSSFMGEWCDCEAFVKGGNQTIHFAKLLSQSIVLGSDDCVTVVENRRQLDQGRVVLRLERLPTHQY